METAGLRHHIISPEPTFLARGACYRGSIISTPKQMMYRALVVGLAASASAMTLKQSNVRANHALTFTMQSQQGLVPSAPLILTLQLRALRRMSSPS